MLTNLLFTTVKFWAANRQVSFLQLVYLNLSLQTPWKIIKRCQDNKVGPHKLNIKMASAACEMTFYKACEITFYIFPAKREWPSIFRGSIPLKVGYRKQLCFHQSTTFHACCLQGLLSKNPIGVKVVSTLMWDFSKHNGYCFNFSMKHFLLLPFNMTFRAKY